MSGGEPERAYLDVDFPADPYPGAVPPFSFVHLDGRSRPLTFDGCWRVRAEGGGGGAGGVELDVWLAGHGAAPLAGRVPLLSYGSNRNPSKITWLRRSLGLTGPVVVLRARTEGLAAVWASGLRARDGQRTSVLGAVPGAVERHALWLATPEQVAVLDRCEGRGDRYRLARLATGAVYLEEEHPGDGPVDGGHSAGGHTGDGHSAGRRTGDGHTAGRHTGNGHTGDRHTGDGHPGGLRVDAPWCYLGLSAARRPVLVDGRPVRCAAVDQAAALVLRGEPAADDGLAATTVHGSPDPDDWPAAVFVYGTLQPGQSAWHLVADHAAGPPRRGDVAGRLGDTGLGYPALLPLASAGAAGRDGGRGAGRITGWVVPVRNPVGLLRRLDAYEGPEYRRIRVAARDTADTPAGPATACWTYTWALAEELLTPLGSGWPP